MREEQGKCMYICLLNLMFDESMPTYFTTPAPVYNT